MMNWSASRLATAQRCLHQYYLKYEKGDYRDSGPAAKRGIAVHFAAKEAHKRQIILRAQEDSEFLKRISIVKNVKPEELYDSATQNPPDGGKESREEARSMAADCFHDEWKKGVSYKNKEEKAEWKKLYAQAKDAAVEMAEAYVGDVAPLINPLAVEKTVEVTPRKVDLMINGRIDLLEDDTPEDDEKANPLDHEVIRDLKTKDRKPYKFDEQSVSDDGLLHFGTGPDADNSGQITMYNLLRLGKTKRMPKHSMLTTVVRTPKGQNLDIYFLATKRDVDDVRLLIRRIQLATEAVTKGVFLPADPAAPGSPCSWCDFNDGTCEFYRRKEQ
jgi:hypothetical protein